MAFMRQRPVNFLMAFTGFVLALTGFGLALTAGEPPPDTDLFFFPREPPALPGSAAKGRESFPVKATDAKSMATNRIEWVTASPPALME